MKTHLSAVAPLVLAFAFAPVASAADTPQGLNQVLQLVAWDEISHASGTDSYFSHMLNPRALHFMAPDANNNIVRKVIVNWQANRDIENHVLAPWPYVHGRMSSMNNGVTYDSNTLVTDTTRPDWDNNVDFMTSIKRRDGTLVAVPFWPHYETPLTTTFTFTWHTSTDNGVTWTKHLYDDPAEQGKVIFPWNMLGMRFHRGIIEEGSDLYAAAYVRYATDSYFRSVVLKSTDGGKTWNYFRTIQNDGTNHYTETAIVRCFDGSWLAVYRKDAPDNSPVQLMQRRSRDFGQSWTADGASDIPTPGLTTPGVDPNLTLLPNGLLVLSYGHNTGTSAGRNVRLAISPSGNGDNWSTFVETFVGVSGGTESTGYTSIIPVNSHRFYQITDTGTNWSYSSEFPGTNPYSLRQKQIDLVVTRRNRIDLGTRLDPNLNITTDLTYSDPLHPEARTTAVYDGSTDYWSGAFKQGTTAFYEIDLGETINLDAIGICLANNAPQSATVKVATTAGDWAVVKTYGVGTKHNAVNYSAIGPIDARYVRVDVTGTGSMVCLNELELFSRADSYENEVPGRAPYGYTVAGSGAFWVREGVPPLPDGYKSKRALYMIDNDGAVGPTITKTVANAQATKTLEFRVRPIAYAASSGAIQWRLMSGSTNAFRLRCTSNGAVQYYNGTVSPAQYVDVAPAGTVPTGQWTHIKVVATATTGTAGSASLYVNGVLKGGLNFIKREQPATTLNGVLFASGGIASVGDEAYFDDVFLTP